MSKRNQREIAEKKHEQEELKHSKFLNALARHLDRFGEILPRAGGMEPLTAQGIEGYVSALYHLSPEQLQRACDETLKVCAFFPKPAEILKAYSDWLDVQPQPGTSQQYVDPPSTSEERMEAQRLLRECFEKIAGAPEPMKGMRWNREDDIEDQQKFGPHRRENGWRPREESLRREMERKARGGVPPRFHVVGKRIAPMREAGED